MPHPEPSPPAATPRQLCWRRLFQFRLRTLLIVTTIVAVWLAWWSHTARRQRDAVAALRKAGGGIIETFNLPLTGGMNEPPQWPTWFLDHGGRDYFATLEVLQLSDTQVTDADLEHLNNLSSLQMIFLSNTPVTDAGLKHFKNLTALQDLSLQYTHVTDTGLEHLKHLSALEGLSLRNTKVADAGLKYLNNLTALRWLDLSSTHITDVGLEHLKGLSALQTLYLVNTKVTDAGVARLKQALPKCRIHH